MDAPPFDSRYDRVARRMTEGGWSSHATTFEEALAYAHYRAKLLNTRQILRKGTGYLSKFWYCQSVR